MHQFCQLEVVLPLFVFYHHIRAVVLNLLDSGHPSITFLGMNVVLLQLNARVLNNGGSTTVATR